MVIHKNVHTPSTFRVVALVKGDRNVASSRYRCWLPFDRLSPAFEKTILLESDIQRLSWRGLFQIFRNADAVFLQRPLYTKWNFLKWYTALFFARVPQCIFDVDDSVHMYAWLKWMLCGLVSKNIFVGSHDLLEKARASFGKKKHIIFSPTTIPLEVYSAQRKRASAGGEDVVIGWIGNAPPQLGCLQVLVDPFRQLVKEGFPFRFLLIGSCGDPRVSQMFDFLGSKYEEVATLPWSDTSRVAEEISRFDIGVMPLEDAPFQKGKCGFKMLEYYGLGIPVVASDIGENRFIMTGELARFCVSNTIPAWVDAVNELRSADARVCMGNLGQERVKEGYDLNSTVSLYEDFFQSTS